MFTVYCNVKKMLSISSCLRQIVLIFSVAHPDPERCYILLTEETLLELLFEYFFTMFQLHIETIFVL